MTLPAWQDPATADNFLPSPAGRALIRLDADATQAVIDHYRGGSSKVKASYILFNYEGDLGRHNAVVTTWAEAVKRARDECLVIYNARTKKSCRPVWFQTPAARTVQNAQLESVRLIPHGITLDANYHKLPVNARLFFIEE